MLEILSEHKRNNLRGIFSVCSAHPFVLETTIKYAAERGLPALVESTSNQVNQYGGYTGMKPSQFSNFVSELCHTYQLPEDRTLLGGDHLGPYPWREEPSLSAMEKACTMIWDYVTAGYKKIHLDASMHCGDDDPTVPLDKRIIAERSATLCQAAEQASAEGTDSRPEPWYVIGSEVPAPGGLAQIEDHLAITAVSDIKETIDLTREAFHKKGLDPAWERVLAIVVQPGVDFGDQTIHTYDRSKTTAVRQFIERDERLVFEAHSTDYQTLDNLSELVEDHFAILKVGPELTFAYREAIFALEQIEHQIVSYMGSMEPSGISEVIDQAMCSNPNNWQAYYTGSTEEMAFSRRFSMSDRIRYYWSTHSVESAVNQLFHNLTSVEIPLSLISQYLPIQYLKIREGSLPVTPHALVEDQISRVLTKYAIAVRWLKATS
jgi:D-tagatose-1,6-bisphosphate aldolase subunit GatZ/KbaZ